MERITIRLDQSATSELWSILIDGNKEPIAVRVRRLIRTALLPQILEPFPLTDNFR